MEQSPRFTIRIGNESLAFVYVTKSGELTYVPYEYRNGISPAANLREAFRNESLLRQADTNATVIIDSPTLLIPLEEYQKEEVAEQYHYTFPAYASENVETCVLPALKNVVAFAVSKDIKTVLTDNFETVKLQPIMLGIWDFVFQRSLGSNNKKLYAYFHDGKVDVCSFLRNRFYFCNTFEATDIHDAMYFMLGAWKQIGGNPLTDDLFLCGRINQRELLTSELKKFLRRIYYINPSGDFNRAPVTQILNMPLDMMLTMM